MDTVGGALALTLLCFSAGCDSGERTPVQPRDEPSVYYKCPELACPADTPVCVEVGFSSVCVSEDQQQCLSPFDERLGGSGLQVADLNGDGLTDLLFENNAGLRVARGSADGGFRAAREVAASVKSFALIDVDPPGTPEILGLDSLGHAEFLSSDGFLTSSERTPSPSGSYTSILGVADVDGDGKPDALLLRGTSEIVALRSTRAFAVSSLPISPPRDPAHAFALDTDGDGTAELLVSGAEGLLVVYRFDVDTWAPITTLRGQLAGVADVDADGVSDLVLDRFDVLTTHLELGHADGTFDSLAEVAGIAVAVADLDADGNVDLMLNRADTLVRLDGRGDATFQESAPLDVHANPDSAGLVTTSTGSQLAFSTGTWIQTVSTECLARP